MNDTFVEFEFKTNSKIINFADLTSFKAYYGKNGPLLYLKNNIDNFKLSANNNFCKTDGFRVFCEDIIIQLDKYKTQNNSNLIHEGSIFTKKWMTYFLICGTLIYLLSFFIETKVLRIAVGISGGFYFLLMWTVYVVERHAKPKSHSTL